MLLAWENDNPPGIVPGNRLLLSLMSMSLPPMAIDSHCSEDGPPESAAVCAAAIAHRRTWRYDNLHCGQMPPYWAANVSALLDEQAGGLGRAVVSGGDEQWR